MKYCAKEISRFFSAAREALPHEKWTPDKKVVGNLLTTTFVNGLIATFRKVIESHGVRSIDYYRSRFKGLDTFAMDAYHSSQYNKMGRDIFEKHFR